MRIAGILRKFLPDKQPDFEDYIKKLKKKSNVIGIDEDSDEDSPA